MHILFEVFLTDEPTNKTNYEQFQLIILTHCGRRSSDFRSIVEILCVKESKSAYITTNGRWIPFSSSSIGSIENDFDRLPRKMLSSWVVSKRPRGAPMFTYGRGLVKAMKKADIPIDIWFDLANDKNWWRCMLCGLDF